MGFRIEPIHLQPVFSRYLAIWLTSLHLLSLLVLWRLQLHTVLKVFLSLLLLSYFIWQVRHHLLRTTAKAIKQIQLESDGNWWLILNDGSKLSGELLPESFVKPWLVVLNFRTGSWFSTSSMLLLPDSLDPDVARRLRIHLLQHEFAQHERPA